MGRSPVDKRDGRHHSDSTGDRKLHGRKPDGRFFALTALSIFALLALCGAGRPPSSAQVKAKAPGAPLQHEVTVTLKLIQVFVTDANGKPALDLERSDFVITDNGKPQTITDFEKHVLALPAPGPQPRQRQSPPRPRLPSPRLPSQPQVHFPHRLRQERPRGGPEGQGPALEFLERRPVRRTRRPCSRCPP